MPVSRRFWRLDGVEPASEPAGYVHGRSAAEKTFALPETRDSGAGAARGRGAGLARRGSPGGAARLHEHDPPSRALGIFWRDGDPARVGGADVGFHDSGGGG